jgi:hypothetical protein
MSGVPEVTVAVTVWLPANTDCVVTGEASPSSGGCTSTASVMSPDPVRTATRAAISRASGVAGNSTAAGDVWCTSAASASALGATR